MMEIRLEYRVFLFPCRRVLPCEEKNRRKRDNDEVWLVILAFGRAFGAGRGRRALAGSRSGILRFIALSLASFRKRL